MKSRSRGIWFLLFWPSPEHATADTSGSEGTDGDIGDEKTTRGNRAIGLPRSEKHIDCSLVLLLLVESNHDRHTPSLRSTLRTGLIPWRKNA